ncbi:hypothetical protein COB21_04065 [Candidatus Aerophobetes bacterium]|uniref:UDP-N-acetylmuramoyl-tripeptide--D-alanyl-D-alanine ligase n=1 Tax=Aerophobetes bacterium TaxID=2030807 RepID=A0A2A4X239_UNCAE|nr:MAG: hypothetical protein COB21_04065 [Candidatus Aerophobetes bacterium]
MPLDLSLFNTVTDIRGVENFSITSVQFDSRKVGPESLFIALKGERVDGHNFLKEVAMRGAKCAVVQEDYTGPSFGLKLGRVKNPLKALQSMAHILIKKTRGEVIGVTGSVGKTTTKDFIRALLSLDNHVLATEGNCNSQAGLPSSVINQWHGQETLVLEMGITQQGEMEKLVAICEPTMGVLTRVLAVHSEGVGSLETIAREKCRLFTSDRMKKAVIHQSNFTFDAVKKLTTVKVGYALDDLACDYSARIEKTKISFYEKAKLSASIDFAGESKPVVENMLAAFATCREMGIEATKLAGGFKHVQLTPHRFAHINKKETLFIDDSYNASPYAVEMAIKAMESIPSNKKIAVLGAMKELGDLEIESHRKVAKLAMERMDSVFFLGSAWGKIKEIENIDSARIFLDKKLLQEKLFPFIEKGDAVLVKGSNSYQMWQIIDAY